MAHGLLLSNELQGFADCLKVNSGSIL